MFCFTNKWCYGIKYRVIYKLVVTKPIVWTLHYNLRKILQTAGATLPWKPKLNIKEIYLNRAVYIQV